MFETHKHLRFKGLKCPHCDYELVGLRMTVCPECGKKFDPNYIGSSTFLEHRRSGLRQMIYLLIAALPISLIIFFGILTYLRDPEVFHFYVYFCIAFLAFCAISIRVSIDLAP